MSNFRTISARWMAIALLLDSQAVLASPSVAARPSPASEHVKLEYKSVGVPAFQDTVLTTQQAKAQQEAFKKLEKQMSQEASARRAQRRIVAPVLAEFSQEGIVAREQPHGGNWQLLAPSLAKLKTAKDQRIQAASLTKRFKAKMEPLLKKTVSVEVYEDPSGKKRVK